VPLVAFDVVWLVGASAISHRSVTGFKTIPVGHGSGGVGVDGDKRQYCMSEISMHFGGNAVALTGGERGDGSGASCAKACCIK